MKRKMEVTKMDALRWVARKIRLDRNRNEQEQMSSKEIVIETIEKINWFRVASNKALI